MSILLFVLFADVGEDFLDVCGEGIPLLQVHRQVEGIHAADLPGKGGVFADITHLEALERLDADQGPVDDALVDVIVHFGHGDVARRGAQRGYGIADGPAAAQRDALKLVQVGDLLIVQHQPGGGAGVEQQQVHVIPLGRFELVVEVHGDVGADPPRGVTIGQVEELGDREAARRIVDMGEGDIGDVIHDAIGGLGGSEQLAAG